MEQRVLVVDDRTEHTAIMSEALKQAGFNILTVAVDGDEELEQYIAAFKPDVLIIDDEVIIDVDGKAAILPKLAA